MDWFGNLVCGVLVCVGWFNLVVVVCLVICGRVRVFGFGFGFVTWHLVWVCLVVGRLFGFRVVVVAGEHVGLLNLVFAVVWTLWFGGVGIACGGFCFV